MNAVIFDIDGTLAEYDVARLGHLVHAAVKQWEAFHKEMARAKTIAPVVRLLKHLHAQGEKIVLCSGRPKGWQAQTEAWLAACDIPFDGIYLRQSDEDALPDPVVKERALARITADGYEPWLVVDDRSSVVAFWRSAGLICLQCQEGNY